MNGKLHNRSDGFTLLESLFAAMLIGLVIAALIASNTAFTMANAAGVDLSTAEFLIEEIREYYAIMAFNKFTPTSDWIVYPTPIDMEGNTLDDFAAFTQKVYIKPVSGVDFETPANPTTDFRKITVRIYKNDQFISEASWIRANLD